MHDIDAFVLAIAKSVNAERQYWFDTPDPFDLERSVTREMIERVEKMKGGRGAAFRFSIGDFGKPAECPHGGGGEYQQLRNIQPEQRQPGSCRETDEPA